MADPARVYDEEPGQSDAQPVTRPNLRALEGGGQTSKPTGQLKSVGGKEDQPNTFDDSDNSIASALSSAEGEGAESGEEKLGKGYTASYDVPLRDRFRETFNLHKQRRKVIGGLAIGGIVTIFVALFLSLLPMKLDAIIQSLEQRYFSSSNDAVENETDNLFSSYVKEHVLPSLNTTSCKSTLVSKDCVEPISGTSPVAKLYDGWRQGNLENKLAEDYGIVFGRSGNKLYMKAPGLPGQLDLTGFATNTDNLFDMPQVSRGELRQNLTDALKSETKYNKVMLRFKVGRLLEEKYGVKRCILGCATKDAIADKSDALKNKAFQSYLLERVIEPRSTMLADAIQCFVSPTCDPSKTEPDTATQGDETNGEQLSLFDQEEEQAVDQAAQSFGSRTLDQLAGVVNGINENNSSAQQYLIKSVAGKFFGTDLSDEAVEKATGPIGWVQFGAQAVQAAHDAKPKLKKIGYAVNSVGMVGIASLFMTADDEMHSGHTDAGAYGSFVSALGAGTQTDGGGADATASPLYQDVVEGQDGSKSSSSGVASLLLPSSYADATSSSASSNSNAYLCDDGKPVPAGQHICNEEKLGQTDGAIDALSDAFSAPPLNFVSKVASVYNSTVGKVVSGIGGAIGSIVAALPGVSSAEDLVTKLATPLLTFLTTKLVPSAISTNMSGARTFDMAAGGMDVMGNDYAQHGLGGEELTPAQSATIINKQTTEAKTSFASQPFFARMFNSSSPYSLVSRVALDMPDSMGESFASLASFLNPAKALSSFSSILHPDSAFADTTAGTDDFGVAQSGYPANDPVFTTDPDTYWQQHNCDADVASNFAAYNSNTATDPNTGATVNLPTSEGGSGTDGCMLIQSAVGDAGAIYNTDTLTSDDLTDLNGSGGSATPTSTAGSTIDTTTLYKDSTSVACAAGTKDIGNYTGYTDGNQVPIKLCAIPNLASTGEESNGGYGVTGANGDAVVNSRVSGAVLAMVTAADNDGVKLDAISSFRTMSHQQALCSQNSLCSSGTYTEVAQPGTSNHQMGLAIDFGGGLPSTPGPIPGNQFWDWLSQNAANFGYKNYPAEAWHWSPTGN